ncbi:MAG: DNA/RNA helicase domain-containing protein, partial [Paludibacter sp.]
MLNYYYKDAIREFCNKSLETIIGEITLKNQFDSISNQNKAWEKQIEILKPIIRDFTGTIFFEFSIPRMGKRVDCLLIIENIVFVIEFKVGEKEYLSSNYEQVWDYALDLKNFHKPSHNALLIPILVATDAKSEAIQFLQTTHEDGLFKPLKANKNNLREILLHGIEFCKNESTLKGDDFVKGSYSPTPTIIEAAVAMYKNHSVADITRSDADAKNLTATTKSVSEIIKNAQNDKKKVICFVTGVPGAGKTLVGLDIATKHLDKNKGTHSIFLSGNGPLVAILQEALTRDTVHRAKEMDVKITKARAREGVKAFIQIIHHYRDAYLVDPTAPFDHVAIFDEAQRAWNKEQTVNFMRRKKNQPDFAYSEPEYLISCLDRHQDWAVIVCLVGGGQEINTGEAGISEWLYAIKNSFPHWEVQISPNLTDSEYNAFDAIAKIEKDCKTFYNANLHLSVSMRSYRAENVALFIKQLLDLETQKASETLKLISDKYPIVITRSIETAKKWLK